MNKNKRFVSLNFKMVVAIIMGAVLTLGMYLMCTGLTNYIIEIRYTSDEAVERNVGAAYDELLQYIDENHIEATDTKALSKWVKEQPYTYFFVYDNYSNIFEAGWWVSSENNNPVDELENEESILSSNTMTDEKSRIDESSFTTDAKNRIITFEDGDYYVFIDVYKEQRFKEMMDIVTLVLCFLTLLLTILIYNGTVLKRIKHLSIEVQRISAGSRDNDLHDEHNDEIGILADNVDNMRASIIQKHNNEKEAWEANSQLITAMSHDIRTPLTSLIGYLDIIDGKKYSSQEEMDKYIESCRDKAFQLKDLSNKMFQYFLVFSKHENDKNLEKYDADVLLQQLLAEHCAEIMTRGYKVDFNYSLPQCSMMVDVSAIRRLFDNVFSNVMKYAETAFPVGVTAELQGGDANIYITNHIWSESKKVESTRIGLKTCEKICETLGGSFSYSEDQDIFAVKISLPTIKEKDDKKGRSH